MTTRTCYTCKLEKPLDEFVKRKEKPLGRGYQCTLCNRMSMRDWRKKNPTKHIAQVTDWRKRNPDKTNMYAANWRRKNPIRNADNQIKHCYGLPPGTYERMLEEQQGRCAICKSDTPGRCGRFHVDHCHDQGHVRGLLCNSCNVGIGHFFHRTDFLEAAIAYLNRTW